MRTPAALLLAIVVTLFAYWPGLTGPLLFDDDRNLQPIRDWLAGDVTWQWVVTHNDSGPLGRMLSMLSFVLNVWITGPGVWGLKVGNVLLHVVNGTLVYLLLRALARHKALFTESGRAAVQWLPVFGAAIWLLHPLFVSTVLYVVQRMAMLSTTFVLLAMLAYLLARDELRAARARRGTWLLAGAAFATVLGALAKENAVLAIPLCGLLELLVFAPAQGQRRKLLAKAFIAATLVVPALAAVGLAFTPYISDGYLHRPFTLAERLMTQPRVLWSYVGSWVLPYGPRLGLFHDDFPISRSWLEPATTIISIVAWISLATVAWLLRRRFPGLILGVGIFLVGQSIESSIFPLLLYFEHRNYLPAVGLVCILLNLFAAIAVRLGPQLSHGKGIAVFASIALCAVLAAASTARAGIWSNIHLIHQQGLTYHPDSRWLRIAMAGVAVRMDPPKYDQALTHAEHLEALPDVPTRRMGAALHFIVACADKRPFSVDSVDRLFAGRPEPLEADLLLAIELAADAALLTGCPLTADEFGHRMSRWLDASRLEPSDKSLRRLRFKLAQLYRTDGNAAQAIQQAKMAYRGEYFDAPVAAFIADVLISQGDFAGARRYLALAEAQLPANDPDGRKHIKALRSQLPANGK